MSRRNPYVWIPLGIFLAAIQCAVILFGGIRPWALINCGLGLAWLWGLIAHWLVNKAFEWEEKNHSGGGA